MKKIIRSIKDILTSIHQGKRGLIALCCLAAVGSGVAASLSVWANAKVLDLGIAVAQKNMSFGAYIIYLGLFCFCLLVPQMVNILLQSYIEPTSALILRTSFKGKMLQKLKRMKYEHFESEESVEIINKAYSRAEEATLHIFPNYFFRFISSLLAVMGTLYIFAVVRWWLVPAILLPFSLDTWLTAKNCFNIYDEMEGYWEKEHRYAVLGNMLKTREHVRENKLFDAAGYLIKIYRERLHARNREFEHFYFKNLRHHFWQQNIGRISQLFNALLLLMIYWQGGMEVGQLVSMTLAVFTTLGAALEGCGSVFKSMGYQVKFYDYYGRYFELSEDVCGEVDDVPKHASIEFCDVSFAYPGSDRQVLSHLSFSIKAGERIAIVGKNGEGKTTLIKLLLGLYQPDEGEIRIGGIPLTAYSHAAKEKLFAMVFQDFTKYDITLQENVGVGDIAGLQDLGRLTTAMCKAKVESLVTELPDGIQTLLGRSFSGSVDLSGGQWQRVAIARAFMGDKPVMILDEPTSQLDPMAESEIYSDFAAMVEGKTAILITHRLGATTITDRILVLEQGRITQSGTHAALLQEPGLYAQMFGAQKQWYTQSATPSEHIQDAVPGAGTESEYTDE